MTWPSKRPPPQPGPRHSAARSPARTWRCVPAARPPSSPSSGTVQSEGPTTSQPCRTDICARYARGRSPPANISPNLAAGRNNSEIVTPTALVRPARQLGPVHHTLDSSGRAFNAATIKACQGSDPTQACQAALGRLHLRDLITYQPVSRFWPLQRDETAIFL